MACHWWNFVATSHVADAIAMCSFVLIMRWFFLRLVLSPNIEKYNL